MSVKEFYSMMPTEAIENMLQGIPEFEKILKEILEDRKKYAEQEAKNPKSKASQMDEELIRADERAKILAEIRKEFPRLDIAL